MIHTEIVIIKTKHNGNIVIQNHVLNLLFYKMLKYMN